MIHCVKFDIMKTVKSISTWLLLAFVLAFVAISVSISYASLHPSAVTENMDIISEMPSQLAGRALGDVSLTEWFSDAISGDFLVLFVIIFSVILVSVDFSSGYIKNIYGHIQYNSHFVLSKIILAALFVLLLLAASFVTILVCNWAFLKAPAFGDLSALLLSNSVRALLCIALASLVICLSFVVKKGLVAMIASILYATMLSPTIYVGVNQLVKRLWHLQDFRIQEYTVIGNITNLSLDTTGKQYAVAAVVAIAAILLSATVSNIVFSKQDVK